MSDKQRRISDIVKNYQTNYNSAVKDYSSYINGQVGTEIVYYQIADEASRTDSTLEDTEELVGANTALKYFKIKKVIIHGVTPLDIQTQLTQRGFESLINNDFIMAPNVGISPRAGEFFTFVDPSHHDFEQQLFVIDDIQFDKATTDKYFRCSFKLYPANADTIERSVIKTFVYDPTGNGNSSGVGDSVLITEEEAANNSMIDDLRDELIDKFTELFYDEGMDTFVYQKALDRSGSNFEYYWNPYLCHFIYKNDIMEKTNKDFLTEIYVQDYTENEYPTIYSEDGYRGTLLYALETKNLTFLKTVESCFYEVSAFDLNKPLNLPFFSTAEKYYLIEPQHEFNNDFWLGAFNWIYDDVDTRYITMNGDYKFVGDFIDYLSTNYLSRTTGDILESKKDSLINHTFYNISDASKQFDIEQMFYVPTSATPYNCDMESLLNNGSSYTENELFNLVRDYFNNTLVLNADLIKKLQYFYYRNNFRTYMLLPMVIYVLQHSKGTELNA